MRMEGHGVMIWTGKLEELGEKPVPVPLCPAQIPHTDLGMKPGLSGKDKQLSA
jgi:hypothetical protein